MAGVAGIMALREFVNRPFLYELYLLEPGIVYQALGVVLSYKELVHYPRN
jgi:hypothetical protein